MNTTAEMFWAMLDAAAIFFFIAVILFWADFLGGIVR